MKGLGKMAVCLAGGLMLSISARADDVASSGNPYGPIVVRNVFGLNPPGPVDPTPPGDPPPKITPNGIMSIFGQLQVLFKVAPIKPGPNAKEESYVLSEGQQQDDIEVTQINEKAGVITFNNHGTVQTLPLANTPALTTSPGGGASNPNFPIPGGGIPARFGGRPGGPGGGPGMGRSHGPGSSGDNSVPGGNPFSSSAAARSGTSAQQSTTPAMTPEERVIATEVQREMYRSQGNPIAGLIPPTALTPPDATGPTGNPLIKNGPVPP